MASTLEDRCAFAATISAVFPKNLSIVCILLTSVCAAQQAGAPQQPQVKVHMLNVCSPSPEEQQEISTALGKIPRRPSFSADFEVDRGRSVVDQDTNILTGASAGQSGETTVADFVRMRREFNGSGMFSNVQYSFSRDSKQMVETLVFRVRDPKDLMQVSIEDSASSVTAPAAMLAAFTPATRIKLERFGKSSVVLARCSAAPDGPAPDQKVYEPLFSSASSVLSDFRGLLGVKAMVPEELTRIARIGNSGAASKAKSSSKTSANSHK